MRVFGCDDSGVPLREQWSRDVDALCSLYAARGLPAPASEFLPPMGLIEPGVAAGFLNRTEAGYALIDGYITHPDASPEARAAALAEMGTTFWSVMQPKPGEPPARVLLWTAEPSIARRAEAYGFNVICREAVVMAVDIRSE